MTEPSELDDSFHVFDTTLRDGAQREGINLTVADKLAIARHLDDFGVGFIEGGWPGANPRDTEFFARAQQEIDFKHAKRVAFGATRRAGAKAAEDPQVKALLDAGTEVICLVAKSHDRHVELALRTTLDENLEMVRHCDQFLMVAVAEVSALRNVVRQFNYLTRKEIPPERFRVVLNRNQKRSLITDGEIEKTLGQKIFWKIPNQYAHIVKAINGGEPIAQLSTSEIAKSLTDLAVHLGAKPTATEKKKESASFRGFLGR